MNYQRQGAQAATFTDYINVIERFENLDRHDERFWKARCPAHDDKKNSLSLWIGDNGSLVFGCHAGCLKPDIAAAVGLTMASFMPSNQSAPNRRAKHGQNRVIAKTYDYRDERGELLYQTVRYLPKDFRQRRPDGRGGWIGKLDDVRRVLYRLPELTMLVATKRPPFIWIVEGEKDAETLWSVGLPATTRVCGAKSPWLPEWSTLFTGIDVVIVPDPDVPGHQSAVTVAGNLIGSGLPSSVRLLALPGGVDSSDWVLSRLAAHWGPSRVKTELMTLARGVPAYARIQGGTE